MIAVRLLGAQSVATVGGAEITSVSAQPKRMALLAFLGLATGSGDGFVSRDTIQALFWPESDQQHARNSLNQFVFQLRTALGSDALVSRGQDRLGLDPALVSVDGREFRAAIAGGDLERAVTLYGGEVLPGFHLGGSVEWEHWLDGERHWFREQAREAALELARQAIGSGDRTAAVRWSGRAVEIDADAAPAAEELRAEIQEVEQHPHSGSGGVPPTIRAGGAPDQAAEPVPSRRRQPVAFAALLIGCLVVVGLLLTGLDRGSPPSVDTLGTGPRLAILPVEDLTGDSAGAYLVEGLHSALIAETGRLGRVLVTPRTSIAAVHDRGLALDSIAAALRVDLVLEPVVRRIGDSIGVEIRLLDPVSGETLWDKRSWTSRANWLELVERLPKVVAREITTQMDPKAELAPVEPRSLAPAAVAAYPRGEALRHVWGLDSLKLAHYDEALRIEPGYAEAHLARARVLHNAGGWFGHRAAASALPEAVTALERAIEIDPDLAEAHLVLANLKFHYFFDWATAEREYRVALEINPGLAEARIHYGNFLRAMRRVEEGVRQIELARDLDPLDGDIWAELAVQYNTLGRSEAARVAAARAAELAPESGAVMLANAFRLYERGDVAEAAAMMESAGRLAFAAKMHASGGSRHRALQLVDSLEGMANRNTLAIAGTYLVLGDTAAAIEWLERGWDERDSNLIWLNSAVHSEVDGHQPMASNWPRFGMHGHPRVQAILARMKFPEPPPRPR